MHYSNFSRFQNDLPPNKQNPTTFRGTHLKVDISKIPAHRPNRFSPFSISGTLQFRLVVKRSAFRHRGPITARRARPLFPAGQSRARSAPGHAPALARRGVAGGGRSAKSFRAPNNGAFERRFLWWCILWGKALSVRFLMALSGGFVSGNFVGCFVFGDGNNLIIYFF